MTRRSALLRLRQQLLARRKGLSKKRAGDLASLHNFRVADTTGDSADLAFVADGDDMSSRLVEMDDRELSQIEQALTRWQQGTFGVCEACEKQIPLTRLNVLPHTAFCIRCERESENHPVALGQSGPSNWKQVTDPQAPMQDQRVDLVALEMQITGER